MRREWYYDFHIHTCLSPCADDDMTPGNIVQMAKLKELDVIAITDHNSCGNCKSAMMQGERLGLLVIPGMELTTKEEVHVLLLYPTIEQALRCSKYVKEHLIPSENVPAFFGRELYINPDDQITGEERQLLIQATDISFLSVAKMADQYEAVMIPAHIEKGSNSLISNLGFIPEESTFFVAEMAGVIEEERLISQHPYLKGCRLIKDSDAHSLGNIKEPLETISAAENTILSVLEALRSGY